jgi:hypothetical protein
MLIDAQALLADNLAPTAVQDNLGNVYDNGAANADLGKGNALWFEAIVTTSFATSASGTLEIQLLTSAAVAMTSPVVLYTTGVLAAATATKGYQVRVRIPVGGLRYYAVNAKIATGVMTAGKLHAALTLGVDANQVYPRAAYAVA